MAGNEQPMRDGSAGQATGPDKNALEQAVTRHTRHMQSGLEAYETVRFGHERPLPVPNGLRVYAVAAPGHVQDTATLRPR
jgi:hypothetical protein